MLVPIDRPQLDAIRRILMAEWDPIGVKDEPEAAHKYDTYAMRIYLLLVSSHSDADQIASYLAQVEMDEMAMPVRQTEDLREVADHIIEKWKRHATAPDTYQ